MQMQRVHVGTIGLALDEKGPRGGPPVLLLHGGGQTRHAWGGAQRELANRGYRAIALDLRGHGESDWAPDRDYSPATIARDVLRIVERTGGRPALVGASLGGLAALLAVGEMGAPCTAVVLVDVTPRVHMAGARRVMAFMRSHPDGFEDLDEAAEAVASYLPHRPRPSSSAGLARNLRAAPDGRLRWHWDPALAEKEPEEVMDTGRLLAAAARVRVPALLVRGALSDVVTVDTATELQGIISHAELMTVSRAGHMVAGDQNDAFTSVVAEFLHRTVPASN